MEGFRERCLRRFNDFYEETRERCCCCCITNNDFQGGHDAPPEKLWFL